MALPFLVYVNFGSENKKRERNKSLPGTERGFNEVNTIISQRNLGAVR